MKTQLENAKPCDDQSEGTIEKSESTGDDKDTDLSVEQMKTFMEKLITFETRHEKTDKKKVTVKPKEDCALKSKELMAPKQFYSLHRENDE